MEDPCYIEPLALKDALLTRESGFVVIDVRDSDWAGGNIRGSVNFPSALPMWTIEGGKNENDLRQFVTTFLERGETVIFHCLKSQVRGPACAKSFVQVARSILAAGGHKGGAPKVMVLKGGYEEFCRQFKDDEHTLFENT